ncbi:hypothetical protein [Streptomyces sp. GbtcB6]|uniref:hypothetical protein n=1 Tax=Streptomyces sp. GbtcB6 TaxID=2824751 RepID=UPI001C308D3C|nr:hypothetical protein [Streptomyces sp. GbtcB6]
MKAESWATEEALGKQAAVVRPSGMRPHNVGVVRRARLFADGKTFVVRDRRLRERRYPVGAGGIRRAVFVPPPPDAWEAVSKRPAERWGVLVFEEEDGHEVLRVPLAEWLPEADAVGILDLKPTKCLDRTGLRDLAATLGIPVEDRPQTPDGGRDQPQSASDRAPDRVFHGELPRWHSWIRGLGILGWFIALIVAFAADVDWCLPIAAGALFAVPAADLVVRVSAWWRRRRDGRSFAEAVLFTPHPAAGAGATPRFLQTASVHVLPHDVVITDTVGRERWLGRDGAPGVARLVRLVSPGDRQPLGVEFRDGRGEVRALLPWRNWFAGPQGQDQWEDLVSALAVPAADEETRRPKRPGGDTEPWWNGHPLAADARTMSPLPAKEARAATSWHSSVIGGNELLLIPLFSLLLLAGLFGDGVPARLAGLFSALTIVAEWVPAATRSLISRFHYDKPHENA